MEERERKAVRALLSVATQYLHDRDGLLDSGAISAGEETIEALAAYGFVEIIFHGRMYGKWVKPRSEILKSL